MFLELKGHSCPIAVGKGSLMEVMGSSLMADCEIRMSTLRTLKPFSLAVLNLFEDTPFLSILKAVNNFFKMHIQYWVQMYLPKHSEIILLIIKNNLQKRGFRNLFMDLRPTQLILTFP